MANEDDKLTLREEAERLAIRARYRGRELQKKPVVRFIKTLAKGAGRSATRNIQSNQGRMPSSRTPKARRIRRGSPARLSKPAFFGATMLSDMDMPSARRKPAKRAQQQQFVIIKNGGVKNRKKKTKRRRRRRERTPSFDFIDFTKL